MIIFILIIAITVTIIVISLSSHVVVVPRYNLIEADLSHIGIDSHSLSITQQYDFFCNWCLFLAL